MMLLCGTLFPTEEIAVGAGAASVVPVAEPLRYPNEVDRLGAAGSALAGEVVVPLAVVAMTVWVCAGYCAVDTETFSAPATSPITRVVRPAPVPW